MKLIVNGHANIGTSLGTRRYMNGVLRNLHWPDTVETSTVKRASRLRRVEDHLQLGGRDALFWTPLHRGPLFAHNHVVTVLDCINIEYPPRGKFARPLVWALFARLLSNARAIVPISKATEAAILRNFPVDASKIRTIAGPATIDETVLGASQLARPSGNVDRPFILMVTNSLPHKNTAAACEAFVASAACKAGVMLRIVGSVEERVRAVLAAPGVASEIRHGVDDATLADWYQNCVFLLSPSLAEGLNLPIAEALSRGSNVLCSDIDVHREFYEGQVRFFDPLRHDAMVAAINDAVASEGRWPRHPNAAFKRSFSDVGAEYRALFLEIAAGR